MSPLYAQVRLILRNDLRLLWRDFVGNRDFLSITLLVVLLCILHAISIPLFFVLRPHPSLGAETFLWIAFAFIMLAAAMQQAIKVLFERSDFDLLLSSPISPRAILLARIAGMSTAAALSVTLFLFPLLNGAVLAMSPRYVAGYLVWLLLAAAVSSAGVWATLLLVQWLGPRRARTWAQVVAALLATGVFILSQAQSIVGLDGLRWLIHACDHPALSVLARAGRGEPLPLLLLAGISAGFTALTARLLGRMFISGVQEGNAIVPKARPIKDRPHVFVEGALRATFWKDVRLIVRDPLLLAQVLPTTLYFIPAGIGVYKLGGIAMIGPLSIVLSGQLSTAFTLVCASGEECWDLIRMSPTAETRLRVAKLLAGMALPALLSVGLNLVLAVLGHPLIALGGIAISLACAAAASWLQVTRIKPTPRKDVMRRGSGTHNVAGNIIGALVEISGAVGLAMLSTSHWIVGLVALGITALLIVACFVLVNVEEISPREFIADRS